MRRRRKPSDYKLFKFSVDDERRIFLAKISARQFMENYGKGKNPRKPGMYYRDGEKPQPINLDDDED